MQFFKPINEIYYYVYRMGICIGTYPEFLLDAWDRWDEQEESDNDRPGMLLLISVIVLNCLQINVTLSLTIQWNLCIMMGHTCD